MRTIKYPTLKTHYTKLRKQIENRAFVSQEKISELKSLEDEIIRMEELLHNIKDLLYAKNKVYSSKRLKRLRKIFGKNIQMFLIPLIIISLDCLLIKTTTAFRKQTTLPKIRIDR